MLQYVICEIITHITYDISSSLGLQINLTQRAEFTRAVSSSALCLRGLYLDNANLSTLISLPALPTKQALKIRIPRPLNTEQDKTVIIVMCYKEL